MYRHRFYRDFSNNDRWVSYRVNEESTDLYIRSQKNFAYWTQKLIRELRGIIKRHIQIQPDFVNSFEPIKSLPHVHPVISKMYKASQKANVGPMASVAGVIAEHVGLEICKWSEEVIVENGGDNFLKLIEPGKNTIFAGTSIFSGKIGLCIHPEKTPLAVCTSSGTVGHSHSQGRADAVIVTAKDTALADAVATGAANLIHSEIDFQAALDYALAIEGIAGVVLIYQDKFAAQGDIELIRT